MIWKLQLGRNAVIAGLLAIAPLFTGSVTAQNPKAGQDRPPQRHQSQPAPRNAPAPPVAHRNSADSNRPPARQFNPPVNHLNETRPPTTIGPSRQNNFNNRPYDDSAGARLKPRQEIGVGAPRPFVDRMRDLTPRERDRVLQNSKVFQNLAPEKQGRIKQQFNQWDRMTPQQRADLREKENTWRNLTPDQRQHIKNDVLPQWKQLPWGRQQVIQQKLGVLQNMPESARNRRLSDPEFTRGLNENEKSMLHDLSHLHVGGAPDPPSNDQ